MLGHNILQQTIFPAYTWSALSLMSHFKDFIFKI